jgi:hypothetical protein
VQDLCRRPSAWYGPFISADLGLGVEGVGSREDEQEGIASTSTRSRRISVIQPCACHDLPSALYCNRVSDCIPDGRSTLPQRIRWEEVPRFNSEGHDVRRWSEVGFIERWLTISSCMRKVVRYRRIAMMIPCHLPM